ncbi:type IV toxin-antitoxin system AbiEi family antitoxin domain-containing protein [Granulicatella seriolae]|uniref:Transcriptional regulator n=1 Tax=Granulicatella seriolae TaxID=2967226 RepID=A0ABT1WQ04_9LACT|nr:transcriptional regulator [Granulicatella seriolae]
MNQKERVLEIAKQNDGIVLASQLKKANIGRWTLSELEKDGKLQLVQRGIYVTEDGYLDDFFLLQQKYKKGIFSHETALFLHGLSDRAPIQFVMTFLRGTSTSRMKEDNVRPVVSSIEFELGVMDLQRSPSNTIQVYDVERTLVDLLKSRYDADKEQLIPAFKKYALRNDKDINKLYRYATIFGVEDKVHNYMEVLL